MKEEKITKKEYKEYLKSSHWTELRKKKIRKFLRKHPCLSCAVCGETKGPIDLHHLTYRKIYDVKTSDLRFLCRTCHATFHKLKDKGKIHFRPGASSHSKFASLKNAVKIARGLYRKNLFSKPKEVSHQSWSLQESIRESLFKGISLNQ